MEEDASGCGLSWGWSPEGCLESSSSLSSDPEARLPLRLIRAHVAASPMAGFAHGVTPGWGFLKTEVFHALSQPHTINHQLVPTSRYSPGEKLGPPAWTEDGKATLQTSMWMGAVPEAIFWKLQAAPDLIACEGRGLRTSLLPSANIETLSRSWASWVSRPPGLLLPGHTHSPFCLLYDVLLTFSARGGKPICLPLLGLQMKQFLLSYHLRQK